MVKSERLLCILEAVEQLRIATPSDILKKLAAQSHESQSEANLKRTIYRDLKHLADHGRLQVRCLNPAGKELSPDEWDQHKNVRVEYSLRASSPGENIPGYGLIADVGGVVIPPAKRAMSWKFSELKNADFKCKLTLVFAARAGHLISFQLPIDDLPAKILFSRSGGSSHDLSLYSDEVEEIFGLRTTSFFLWDPSVSRHTLGARSGHAVLSVDAQLRMTVEDLNSSQGTAWLPLDQQILDRLVSAQVSPSTEPANLNPLYATQPMNTIGGREVVITSPAVVRFGNFKMIVTADNSK